MFLDLDFSQIQIRLTALMTPAAEPNFEDVETNEEVVVTDGPGGAADDLVNPSVQNNNPFVSP